MTAQPLCPESSVRAAMTDDQFWAHVYPQPDEDAAPDDVYSDDPTGISVPCPICGSTVECGYDTEGRPMIHAVDEVDE